MDKVGRLTGAKAVVAHLRGALAATWSELVARSGKSAVLTARAHGLIAAVLPGIYAVSGTEHTFRVRATALTLWTAPNGRVTGLAAAHLWAVIDAAPSTITVHVPPAWHLAVPDWARLLRVAARGDHYSSGGIALVSAADAVVQSWREARPDVGASTVIAAVDREVATASELREALALRKRIPGRQELDELLSIVGDGVTSYLEFIARRDVFPPRFFPQLRWQVEVWPNGRRRVMDACDAEAMIDLEFDGRATHGGDEAFVRDRERDNEMRSIGYEPLRYTFQDVTKRPQWCRQNYLAVRAVRLKQLGRVVA